jgi:hypothetical protein
VVLLESNAATAARAVAPEPIISTEDGAFTLFVLTAFLKPSTSVEKRLHFPSWLSKVLPLLIFWTSGSIMSAQLRASSFKGIVSEKPVHSESLLHKKSCKDPEGTSKDVYEPLMFKNLYAAA